MAILSVNPLITSFILLVLLMTIIWVFSYRAKRLDFVDVAWGLGFLTITLTGFLWSFFLGSLHSANTFFGLTPRLIICLLVAVWAARLSLHILQRWLRRPDEDVRYQDLRKKWKGYAALNSYVQIFLLQAVLIYIICLPVLVVTLVDPPLDGWLVAGLIVWLIGFFFEAVGDAQLAKFASDRKHKGTLLTTGLWKYTRHPNYFGEVTQWWGIFLIACSLTLFSPYYLILIAPSPLLLSFLILKISGVPLTEKLMSKRDGWKEYAEKTSKFLPLRPKKG